MANNPWYSQPTVRGYSNPEVASALQKAIRRGESEKAVFWAIELDRSGYAQYVWKRLLVITSEDVGLGDRYLPSTIWSLYQTWKEMKSWSNGNHPERLPFVHAVILLATAEKSRMCDHAACGGYNTNEAMFEIPDEAYDLHTAKGKRMGRGLEHWYSEAAKLHNEADLGFDPFIEWNAKADQFQGEPVVRKSGKATAVVDDSPLPEALFDLGE
jgi:replication-associated recombination protein RarA